MITVTATSDIHGSWKDLPHPTDANLLVFAGDVLSSGHLVQNAISFLDWAKQFVPYFDDVIVVPGNHDRIFASMGALMLGECWNRDIVGLIDNVFVSSGGCRIYGTPWSTPFGHKLTFMAPEAELTYRYATIPDDTQLLITHGPPRGVLDVTHRNGKSVGSVALRDRIDGLPNLRAVICGHIHESHGRQVIRQDCVAYNVAALDENYDVRRDEAWTTFVI